MTWGIVFIIYNMKKGFPLKLLKLNIYWSYSKIYSKVFLQKMIVLISSLAKYVLKHSELELISELFRFKVLPSYKFLF